MRVSEVHQQQREDRICCLCPAAADAPDEHDQGGRSCREQRRVEITADSKINVRHGDRSEEDQARERRTMLVGLGPQPRGNIGFVSRERSDEKPVLGEWHARDYRRHRPDEQHQHRRPHGPDDRSCSAYA